MNNNIILLTFNNYFNRINKVYNTVDEYMENAQEFYDWNATNNTFIAFNENDGVTTNLIMNHFDREYDYLLVCDEDNNILSRWFIIDPVRNLKGQYNLSLKRDSVADKRVNVENADSYIYKGNALEGSALLYNSEGLQVNQIKKEELLLKDSTNCPWIVGYINNKIGADTFTGTVYGAKYDYLGFGPFASVVSGAGTYNNVIIASNVNVNLYIRNQYFIGWDNFTDKYNLATNNVERTDEDFSGSWSMQFTNELGSFNPSAFNRDTFINSFLNTEGGTLLNVDDDSFKICKVGNIYYKIEFINKTDYNKNISNQSTIDLFRNAYNPVGESSEANVIKYLYSKYSLRVTNISSDFETSSYQVYFSQLNDSYSLIDAPYKMFCLPYFNTRHYYDPSDPTKYVYTTKEETLQIITALATALGDNLHDLQILPYCPNLEKYESVEYSYPYDAIVVKASGKNTGIFRQGTNELKSLVYWCDHSTFNFNVSQYVPINNAKLDNETTIARIVSPNYNGTFEFNKVKNGGINVFNIDCTYKPYTPHIHVQPDFAGLYGKDFKDSRGLICGGDFSIPRITDAWASYEINNKNYQLQFERQIETLELANTLGYVKTGVNAFTGLLGNNVKNTGNLRAINNITALGTTAFDLVSTSIMNNERISAMEDQFNYSLENIQARPYSLTNVGVLNYDFKFYPFIELYDCTDIEKEALRNKIKYEGMTINVIGKIKDFVGDLNKGDMTNFIRAKLIRIDIASDTHLVNDINNELSLGLYFE